jgi:hypothetical protein
MTRIVITCLLIAAVSFAQTACFGNECEIDEVERIATQFAEKILSGNTEDMPSKFSMTDSMKEKLAQMDAFKEWANGITKNHGLIFERENVETTFEDNRNRYVTRIQYKYGSNRVIVNVFTSRWKSIYGFTWSWPNDGKQSDHTNWAMYFGLLLPVVLLPVIILITYFGEKWRAASLRNQAEWGEDRVIDASEVYRESQNPLWAYVLILAICLCVVPPMVASLFGTPNVPLVFAILVTGITSAIILAIMLVIGMFIEVSNENLVVRWGVFKYTILTVSLKSIRSAEVVTFSPITDFGGWGIRMGKGGWAYFMSGTQGVQVVTNENKKYIIGSDTPNLLYKVIQAKRGIEQTDG